MATFDYKKYGIGWNNRATWFDRSICDEPCGKMHTRYVDTGEVADPGGCYWDRTNGGDDGNGAETGPWSDEDDPVNPSHYVLPGGEQVSWISRYLTSNAGQALQYIARSSRLDGNNKSSDVADRIEDLKKSVWFIEDEISRLEEEGNK